MTFAVFLLRIGLAFLLGALVGVERQYRQKSAGLKTNTLVSVGSAAFVLLSLTLTDMDDGGGVYRGDATRVAGQIVTGIGFLGAGVIMKAGRTITGLNTAATIWCSAAIGTLAGAGLWMQATAVAFAVLLAHIGLRPLNTWLSRRSFRREEESSLYYYYFNIRCKEHIENHIRVLLLNTIKSDEHLQLRSLKSSEETNPAYARIEAEVLADGKHDAEMERLAGLLTLEYGVMEVSWEVSEQRKGEE